MIRWVDGEQLHEAAKTADFLVMEFSRPVVASGLIGDALDRLLQLSDSAEHVRRFGSSMTFVFLGYDHDPRELYEIPECRAFFQQLTREWPYWLHFLEKDADSIGLVLRLLCQVDVSRRSPHCIDAHFRQPDELGPVLLRLFNGMNDLYDVHGLSEAENLAMTARINAALERIMR